MAIDEADAAMAQAEKMAGHLARGVEIIDRDGRKARRRPPRGHQHGGDAGIHDGLQRLFRIPQRRRQNHAIHAPGDQLLHRFAFTLQVLATFKHQLTATEARLFQAAQQQFTEIGGRGARIKDTDMHRIGAGQASRGHIG